MIFIVKCAYCGKTYIVDTDEKERSFLCPSCQGANGLEDVKERFKNAEELTASKHKTPEEIYGEDCGLRAIKAYRSSYYPVAESDDEGFGTESNYYTEGNSQEVDRWNKSMLLYAVIIGLFILFVWGTHEYENAAREAKIDREVQMQVEEMEERLGHPLSEDAIWYIRNQVERRYDYE